MFMKRKFAPLQAVLWAGLVLAMMFPVLGLFGPRPGAPIDRRSFGMGDFWLIRIVETATPIGASWFMETKRRTLYCLQYVAESRLPVYGRYIQVTSNHTLNLSRH